MGGNGSLLEEMLPCPPNEACTYERTDSIESLTDGRRITAVTPSAECLLGCNGLL